MALELVAGAFLSSSLKFLIERMGSEETMAYLRGKLKRVDTDKLVGKLKNVVNIVMAVIEDADQKQRKNKSVELWLDMLQQAVFDAEDLFDFIETKAMKLKQKSETSIATSKKHNFLKKKLENVFKPSLESDVKELLEQFENIVSQSELLGLSKSLNQEKQNWRLPSTSLVDDNEVYGRDDDKRKVIEFLLSDDETNEKTSVVSIVGMGGLGKSTLAQTAFNDTKVDKHFEMKAWVCVSEKFDIEKVTKTILEKVTSRNSDATDLDSLQVKLKESLLGKKFLIVLDDVWNEKPTELDILCFPFKYGAHGSKIIVTTRSKRVASSMRSVQAHQIQKLSEAASWKLFSKEASGGGRENFSSNQELDSIGREIVKKCDGLPLALKALGGLLRSSFDVGQWRRILKSDFWDLREDENDILPALKLSYHYLPSQLKRCFAFCSIFPSDYKFKKEELILLWMAESLLESPMRNRRIEDVGEEYFNGLVSRSFFQRSNSEEPIFVMHDLIHYLARSVSAAYCLHLEDEMPREIDKKKLRHLGFIRREVNTYKRFRGVLQSKKLRTFISPDRCFGPHYISTKAINDLLSELKRLRVLSLSGYKNVDHLPDSIGDLTHLRYLNISHLNLTLLPESVCNLFNLQTLKLNNCRRLKNLPKDMHRLLNLRHLNLQKCDKLELPAHFSELKNLQTLGGFNVGKDNGVGIGYIRELSHLRGELQIKNLENVGILNYHRKVLEQNHLGSLSLGWSHNSNTDTEHARDVFELLKPNRTLEKLKILYYPGITFSNWLGFTSFDNIASLSLSHCKNCTSLPPLGQLPSLKHLKISYFYALVDVGPEFYKDGSCVIKPFQSLETLSFKVMWNWERWFQDDSEAFSKLIELEIENCRNFTGVLPEFLPSLEKLRIFFCPKLAFSLPNIPLVQYLSLSSFKVTTQFESCFGGLKQMEFCTDIILRGFKIPMRCLPTNLIILLIDECEGIEFHCPHMSLESLEIRRCRALKYLPMEFFPKLRELSIRGSENLDSLSMSYGQSLTLKRLHIASCKKLKSLPDNCPEIEWLPEEDGIHSSLTALFICNSDKLLSSLINNCGLKRFRNLATLGIQGSNEDIKSFPEDGLLPISITTLCIRGFPRLNSLDKFGLQKLTSLEELSLVKLPKLNSLPGEDMSVSLKSLYVSHCSDFQRISREDLPTSLETLRIDYCNNFRIILGKALPGSLKTLWINSCGELQRIEEEGLPSSLVTLKISRCPNLKTIPTKHFPQSLQYLEVQDCSLLAKKCKAKKGEYWSYIAHVTYIKIDDDILS